MNELEGSVATEAKVYGVGLKPMSNILESHGFSSSLKSSLRGISGAIQNFDIVARKDSLTIVIDVLPSADKKKCEMALINMRAKTWDCAPELAIAISPVEASKEMKELAKFYKLTFIEALNETELEVLFDELANSLN